MNREEQIKAIYEKIPGFDGYLINRKGEVKKEDTYRKNRHGTNSIYKGRFKVDGWGDSFPLGIVDLGVGLIQTRFSNDELIIGHPVMIGDVLDYIEKNSKSYTGKCEECGTELSYDNMEGVDGIHWYCGNENCYINGQTISTEDFKAIAIMNLIDIGENFWKEKRKPLEEQSDDCIEYIYNLIKE